MTRRSAPPPRREDFPVSRVVRMAVALIIATVPACPRPLQAADRAEAIAAAVDRAVRPLLAAHDVPGIAVAVTVDGRQQFFNFGVASKERNTPVTQDTLFELGSVSKTFTATLIAYAQALGKLSLDDHPSRFMPALRGSAIDKASVLNLATYTAGGLPLQFPDGVKPGAGMTAYFRDWKPSATPGAQRRYSNPSIGLAGYVASLAMTGDFAALVESELFVRLGLRHSFIRVPHAAMAAYAWGYKAGKPTRMTPGVLGAQAYGITSSAADMIRFVEANMRPDTLAPAMRRAIEGTHVGYFRIGDMTQGLGWEQYPFPITLEQLSAGNARTMAMDAHAATPLTPPQRPSGPTLFNKTGSTNGFGAYVAFVPAKRIGIVMLANRNLPIPARVAAAHAVLAELAAQTP